MSTLSISEQDLVENPAPRVPVCLCIDTSGSMSEVVGGNYVHTGETRTVDGQTYNIVTGGVTKIAELIDGINMFYDAILDDDDACDAAEICIVEFNSGVSVIQDFANVERIPRITSINTDGFTHIGEGVNLALDTLEARKKLYSDNGVLYYQPWLVLMTDGEPEGESKSVLDRAINRVTSMVSNKKLTVFPIGIGPQAGMSTLQLFSPNRSPIKLKGLNFTEFFEWLSKSVSRVSQSTPGDTVKLDLSGLAGWAEL